LYVGKNFVAECSPRYLFEATKEFFDVEEVLPKPSHFWDGDGSDAGVVNHGHLRDLVATPTDQPLLFFGTERPDTSVLDTIQRVADIVSSTLGIFDPDQADFRHGPGAVSDLSRGDYKYNFPNWGPRLEALFPYDRYGTTSLGLMEFDGTTGYDVDFVEPASDLLAVPKTMKGPRLIAKEPTCHQWVQQAVRDFLYRSSSRNRYTRWSLNFDTQEANRSAASLASVLGTDATMDLKSASDRISCALVERLFRRNPGLLGAFAACRTRYLRNTLDKKHGGLWKLHKFSTQGSALTFPVQSLVFFMITVGVGVHLTGRFRVENIEDCAGRVRIFGDDIVLPVEWEPMVEEIFHLLGLRVNHTKTHTEGNFRESCGMDAWMGYDVSPPHVLSDPVETDARSLASWLAVTNNFFVKGFWHAAAWLDSRVPTRILRKIPVVSPASGWFGLRSFSGGGIQKSFKTRWNSSLHRTEHRVLGLFAKSRVSRTDQAANLLQYFTEAPPPYIKYESGVVVAGVPVKRDIWVPSELIWPERV
jgi:hypothetical protein